MGRRRNWAVLGASLGAALVALGGAGAGVGAGHPAKRLSPVVHIRGHRVSVATAARRTADVPEPALDPRYDTTPTPAGGESIPQEFTSWNGETGSDGWIPEWARAEWLKVAIAAGMAPDPADFLPTTVYLGDAPVSFGVHFVGPQDYWAHFTTTGLGTNLAESAPSCAAQPATGRWVYTSNLNLLISNPVVPSAPGALFYASVGNFDDYLVESPFGDCDQQEAYAFDSQIPGGQLTQSGTYQWLRFMTKDEWEASFFLDQPLQLFANQPSDYTYAFTPHYNGAGFRAAIASTSDAFRQLWDNALDPGGTGGGGPPPPPAARPPLIFLPGTLGSYLSNGGAEKWPNIHGLIDGYIAHVNDLRQGLFDVPWDTFLDDLEFSPGGAAANNTGLDASAGDNGVIPDVNICYDLPVPIFVLGVDLPPVVETKHVCLSDFPQYGPTIAALKEDGYTWNPADLQHSTLFPLGYDWRYGAEVNEQSLVDKINWILQNTDAGKAAGQVDILAHSQGGLIAETAAMDNRTVADPVTRKSKIARIVTLGTPYLGTPKFLSIYEYSKPCEINPTWFTVPVIHEKFRPCLLSTDEMQKLVQNFPGAVELLPDPQYYAAAPSPWIVDDAASATNRAFTWQDSYDRLTSEGKNTGLILQAAQFHANHDAWRPVGDTEILRVYGQAQPTIGQIQYTGKHDCLVDGLFCSGSRRGAAHGQR